MNYSSFIQAEELPISRPAVRCAALLIGIALAAVVISSVYAAGLFNSGPELPEVMEGEAAFVTDNGEGKVFHFVIDYKRKRVQLASMRESLLQGTIS